MEEEKEEESAATGPGHPAPARTSGPSRKPGHPTIARKSGAHRRRHPKLNHVSPDIRPEARTSGSSRAAGHPASSPEIRAPPFQRATRLDPDSLDIRPQRPDIRRLGKARTSGPPACVQRIWAVAHVPLRPLDYIYSPSTYILGLALC